MTMIHFLHNYPKLWNQHEARLILVQIIALEDLSSELIKYDTFIDDGIYYQLPQQGKVMQLVFLGNKNIPFCTLRQYNPQKYSYYLKNVNKVFTIRIGTEQ